MTDRRNLADGSASESNRALLDKMEALAEAGVDWIQIREKDLSGKALAAVARETLGRNAKLASQTRVLLNDRLDIAIAERAGGVHLRESSLPLGEAKRLVRAPGVAEIVGQDFLLGVSTHSLEGAKTAAAAGADYVFFGPVFATPSKAVFGAPHGVAQLAEVCAGVKIPVLAIGGITAENAAACLQAGAAGIAAIRLFQDAADPRPLIQDLRRR